MSSLKIVIIGGGSAGTTCAYHLRKKNKDVNITIIEQSNNVQYSPCAMPYVLSGEIKDFDNIYLFNKKDYEENNIKLLLNSKVKKIDKKNKKIILNDKTINYDKLIIATGSSAFIPPIKGIDKVNYYTLKTIDHAKNISKKIKKNDKSVIVGGGMIGIELAYSLDKKNEKVTIIESKENILSNMFDNDMSEQLKKCLENTKIKIIEKSNIKEITKNQIILDKEKIEFDKLFLCTGVRPNIELAKSCGIKVNNGIIVNDYLKTSDKNIYACGDCVECVEFNTNKKILSMLGSTAVRQANIIANNVLKRKEKFLPVLNNTISKIDDWFIGATGLTESRAKKLGIKTISTRYTGNVKSEYYSEKEKIIIKMVCNHKKEIIGCQIIGNEEVVGRLNLMTLVILKKIKLNELIKLETCYNPASAPIIDPITQTAQICLKKLKMKKNEKS